MSGLSVWGKSPSPERLYALLGQQVRSYHKHHHMGENTSVPVELARDLLESLEYTLELGGGALEGGQRILQERTERARSMLELITATAPHWQTECRWEALRCLRNYLEGYDPLHLAHRGPDNLFYPVLTPLPGGIRGIDHCLFMLRILWLENQIMAGAEGLECEKLWDRLHRDTLNQCEQLLVNATGKALLYREPVVLVFDEKERSALGRLVREKRPEELREALKAASRRLCRWLELTDGNAGAYAAAILPSLALRLEEGSIHGLFL